MFVPASPRVMTPMGADCDGLQHASECAESGLSRRVRHPNDGDKSAIYHRH